MQRNENIKRHFIMIGYQEGEMRMHFQPAAKFILLAPDHFNHSSFRAATEFLPPFIYFHAYLVTVQRMVHMVTLDEDVFFHPFHYHEAHTTAGHFKLAFVKL